MGLIREEKLEQVHESGPQILPGIGQADTTSLLIAEHSVEDSQTFTEKITHWFI